MEPNQQLYLKRVPTGLAGPGDFEVREAPVPEPGDGQVLVRTHYVGVDAALRLIVRDSDDFLFRVRPGDLVHGTVAGQVVRSRHPGFAEGELVTGALGVQRYGLSDGRDLEKCDTKLAPLSTWLGGFGVSGLTAYFAVLDVCKPGPGQTVLVNGAAGAVGSMAGQFARIAGARTLGLTGSDEKCRWLVDALGYDVALNYRDADLSAQLERAAPDRLDVIFDNVGGRVLDESLRWIGLRGCVLLCGSTSQYPADQMEGPRNYIWLGTMRARMEGFVVFDYADRYKEARADMARWIAEGALQLPEQRIQGDVADFPAAFRALYQGANRGKLVLQLPGAD